MRKQFALGVALALGVGAQAMAAEGLSYNYVQAGYAKADLVGVNLSGFSLGGSVAIGENFLGFANYGDMSKSGGHFKPFSAGVGFHTALGTSVDFVSGVSFESVKISGLSSESGWGANVGLRGLVGMVELNGGLKYVSFGDGANDWVFNVGGRYNFTESLSAGADFSKYDDLDLTVWGINLRYSF
jgi:hypothetical protein